MNLGLLPTLTTAALTNAICSPVVSMIVSLYVVWHIKIRYYNFISGTDGHNRSLCKKLETV